MHDRGYLADPNGVELLPGATDALRALRRCVDLFVLVGNQSGIARGMIRPEQHAAVHARFCELLAAEGVVFDAYYYCVHGPDDGCDCRKPRPGMLRTAAREHDIDLAASMMIGDKESDMAAGRTAGCATALFASDWRTFLDTLPPRFVRP